MATPNPNPRLLIDVDLDAWQDRAVCNGVDFNFVPLTETATALLRARTWCDGCPVRQECLMSAMLHRSEGFWGGTSTDQRRKLMRVRTRAKCPLCLSKNLVFTDQHELCLACGVSWVRDAREVPLAATPAPGAA